MVFVDYRRVDAGSNEQSEFYFVFLRERVGEEIQSRVVRLCRVSAATDTCTESVHVILCTLYACMYLYMHTHARTLPHVHTYECHITFHWLT